MIRPDDFRIEIGYTERGAFVRVTHTPTGNARTAEPVAPSRVGNTRDSLIRELRNLVYSPDDIRVDIGRTGDGDSMRVIHLPFGIQRRVMVREGRTQDELLDEILEELLGRESIV